MCTLIYTFVMLQISVNKKNLRFSEYDNEPESSTTEQNDEPGSITEKNIKKVVLFDDSEEDEFEPNFEVKPHLEGEQGVKVLVAILHNPIC